MPLDNRRPRLCYICCSLPSAMTWLYGWSLLFYISLSLSLSISFSLTTHFVFDSNSDPTTLKPWKTFYLSACVTPVTLHLGCSYIRTTCLTNCTWPKSCIDIYCMLDIQVHCFKNEWPKLDSFYHYTTTKALFAPLSYVRMSKQTNGAYCICLKQHYPNGLQKRKAFADGTIWLSVGSPAALSV